MLLNSRLLVQRGEDVAAPIPSSTSFFALSSSEPRPKTVLVVGSWEAVESGVLVEENRKKLRTQDEPEKRAYLDKFHLAEADFPVFDDEGLGRWYVLPRGHSILDSGS